ncbi:alpha-amylase family protein [Salinivibrio sp. IB872]|uniref:alpha-amylase family protein n=1 Tax=Salinivibrio sp. IB872 TaxID=1766123 RepID=UPI0009865C37|nr:alpha-amylase family protein [Salinivibrio sp. IB872]OOF26697.1 alpha-amylase [Salinivibrio sp. IB872]
MKRNYPFALAISLFIYSATAHSEAILHAFNWPYQLVEARAEHIAEAGYKKVLVAPAMKSSGTEWWARYQPQDLRVIDSPLGNKQDFQAMIAALGQHGVAVYADVVLNHMANESGLRDDLNYPSAQVLEHYAQNQEAFEQQTLFGQLSQHLFSSMDFHPEGCITQWHDPGHVQYWRLCGGEGDVGLPDLDPNQWVVEQQRAYLSALKVMGVKGFRVDAVKHMSMYHINQVFTDAIREGMHIFGEVITSGGAGDQSYEAFLLPYLQQTTHSAYDFPLFSQIRRAFSFQGSLTQLHHPESVGQALDKHRAITFTITHDIPTNDGFRYQIMDPTDEALAYAYILGKDGGSPLIYSDELSAGEDKDNGRWQGVWKQPAMKAMLRFHNAMHGKPMTVIGSTQCLLLFKRDQAGIVAINKCDEPQSYTMDTREYPLNWYRPYYDVLSDATTTIASDFHTITIPARSAQMYMH